MTNPLRITPALLIALFSLAANTAEASVESYCLPLVGNYGLYHDDSPTSRGNGSPNQLGEITQSSGSSVSVGRLLMDVESYAVQGQFIVGISKNGYFIFDTRSVDNGRTTLPTFPKIDEWKAALLHAGISPDIQLLNPDATAATLPDSLIRPWKYRVMRNRLGISDDYWSLIVQIIGMVICLFIGMVAPPTYRLLPVSILVGWAVNVIGQLVIAGGGPGAFVGFVALPFFCLLAGHFGRLLRRATFGWKNSEVDVVTISR